MFDEGRQASEKARRLESWAVLETAMGASLFKNAICATFLFSKFYFILAGGYIHIINSHVPIALSSIPKKTKQNKTRENHNFLILDSLLHCEVDSFQEKLAIAIETDNDYR